MALNGASDFLQAFTGPLHGILSWQALAKLWDRVDPRAGWYLYCVGEPAPPTPASAAEVVQFIARIDPLLRQEHDADYCGIVYADDLDQPRFIKIFDPHHLGSSCSTGRSRPLPGWIMSTLPPKELKPAAPLPLSRRRWWRSLVGKAAARSS